MVRTGRLPCNAVFGFSSYSTTDISGPEPSFTLFAQEYQINPNQNPGNTACLPTQLIGSTVYCYQVACPTASCTGSPVVVDPTGTGFALTSAANGVKFDIAGIGKPVKIAWSAEGASTAFLALPGSDGLVHNGQQLFGNFTPQPITVGVSPNGFAALAVYDDPKNGGNGDGIIDARDPVFASLRLWVDTNHDGISQPEELYPLLSLGINSISLNYKQVDKVDQYGNIFRYRTQLNPDFSTDAGKIAYDVFLVIDQSTAKRRTTSPHFQQVGINVRPRILAQAICP